MENTTGGDTHGITIVLSMFFFSKAFGGQYWMTLPLPPASDRPGMSFHFATRLKLRNTKTVSVYPVDYSYRPVPAPTAFLMVLLMNLCTCTDPNNQSLLCRPYGVVLRSGLPVEGFRRIVVSASWEERSEAVRVLSKLFIGS